MKKLPAKFVDLMLEADERIICALLKGGLKAMGTAIHMEMLNAREWDRTKSYKALIQEMPMDHLVRLIRSITSYSVLYAKEVADKLKKNPGVYRGK
jgi:hypothetical protein